MIAVFIVLIIVVAAVYGFFQQPQFGSPPSGARLNKIERSPNYRNGQFQNISLTPSLMSGSNYVSVMLKFIFGRDKRNVPSTSIPSRKTNLHELDPGQDLLVWFGHSSYFLQLDGKKILVDPVLSGGASPVKFTTRSFPGADIYTVDDIPEIDYLLITHDHYDHLDYDTILKLRGKVGRVITGLGVGSHLEHWGYPATMISELDWDEDLALDAGFSLHTTPARHFSGRLFKRNQSIWLSYVLSTPTSRLFIGGDSGYDAHFAQIGEQYGPFDLAILENGQYNENWRHIHAMPEEVVQAAIDLRAKKLLPVHWSKFALALHAWDEPILRVTKEARNKSVPILHPMIGEALYFKELQPSIAWWEELEKERA